MHTVRNKMIRSLPKNFDLIDWKKSLTIEIVNPSGIRLLQTCRNYAWSHDRHLKNACLEWNWEMTNASSKRNKKSTIVQILRDIVKNVKYQDKMRSKQEPPARRVIRNINLSKCEKTNRRNIWRWANAKKPHRQSGSLSGKKTLSKRLEYIFKQNPSYDTDDSFAKHLQDHQNAFHLGEGVSVWPVPDHLLRDVGVVEKTRLQRWWCNFLG